jgi:hemolysin D
MKRVAEPRRIRRVVRPARPASLWQRWNDRRQKASNRREPFAVYEYHSPAHAVTHAQMPPLAGKATWVIASMIMSLIVVLGVVSVDKVVSASGVVISKTPEVVVQSLEAAIIREILVREGQRVKAGDLIARLDSTFAGADLGNLEGQLRSVNAEVARLDAEAAKTEFDPLPFGVDGILQASIFGFRKGELQSRLQSFDQKIRELREMRDRAESEQVNLKERLKGASAVQRIREELEKKKIGSKLATLSAQDASAEIAGALEVARYNAQSASQTIAAMESERNTFIQGWYGEVSQRLLDAKNRMNVLGEEVSKAKLRKTLVDIRAQVDGIVQSLAKLSVGSVLAPGQPLMTIISTDGGLEVEANVLGRDSGFVDSGKPVSVKFDTLPFSTYGMYRGTVISISPDAFIPQQEAANPTSSVPLGQQNEPYYRARISLDKSELRNLPANFQLMPGMPVVADVRIGERSVLSYFLEKIIPVFKEGFREP